MTHLLCLCVCRQNCVHTDSKTVKPVSDSVKSLIFSLYRRQLLRDEGTRAALHDAKMAPPLPPVGTEIFRRLTLASLDEIQRRYEAEEKEQQQRKEKNIEVLNKNLNNK